MPVNRFLPVLAVLTLIVFLGNGCGKKGHLYLPDRPHPATASDKAVPEPEEETSPSLPSAPSAP